MTDANHDGGESGGAELSESDAKKRDDAKKLADALNQLASRVKATLDQMGLARHVVIISAMDTKRGVAGVVTNTRPESPGEARVAGEMLGEQALFVLQRLPDEEPLNIPIGAKFPDQMM